MCKIQSQIQNGVALLTLNNPSLNVVTVELTKKLSALLDEFSINSDVRALVITGSGERAFCAGSDIKEFSAFIGPEGRVLEQKMNAESATYTKLAKFPKPTIAALNAHALGGGLELAVCCDLIVAGEGVTLSLPEVKLGVFPGSGGTIRVTKRVGEGRAKEMMFFGEPIDAQTAMEWGLINRVVSQGTVITVAVEWAERLANLPNRALQLCKESIALAYDVDEEHAMEQNLPLIEAAFQSDDVQEGVRAFFAKEKPTFRHS